MDKEQTWMKRRLGMITASEVGEIMSAKGGIIEGNLSYIRKKRFERRHGYALPVSARAMDIGNQQEPMIYEWAKANLGLSGLIYSKDCSEIPFWECEDCPIGASPDSFTADESTVVEFKCLVGNTATEFFMDTYTSYEEKKTAVWKDHGDQILAQFASNPKVEQIFLVKHAPQLDDVMQDTDSPLASWRGVVFQFKREDYVESIEVLKERVRLFDAMIDAEINPAEFKKGEWLLDEEGKLRKK